MNTIYFRRHFSQIFNFSEEKCLTKISGFQKRIADSEDNAQKYLVIEALQKSLLEAFEDFSEKHPLNVSKIAGREFTLVISEIFIFFKNCSD